MPQLLTQEGQEQQFTLTIKCGSVKNVPDG